jgi:membrane protease YdiL (CAAX protease family)
VPGARLVALLELSLFVAGYYFCFWRAGETMSPGRVALFTVALIALPFVLNVVHRLRPDQIGYDFGRFREGMRAALIVMAALLVFGLFLGAPRPPTTGVLVGTVRMNLPGPFVSVAAWFFFALLQQSVLMGFVFNRLERIGGSRVVAVAGTAALFSLSHWPNLPLAAITLVGGFLFACLYLRYRNVIPLACVHGAMTFFLFSYLSGAVSFSVGRAYRAGSPWMDSGRISAPLGTLVDLPPASPQKGVVP